MNPPLYVCLRIPEFAAQALVRLRPNLGRSPVAVLAGDPPFEKTCAVTLQARRLGVQHGMTRTELESFPGLAVLRRSVLEERSAAAALMEMAARFTPRMEELPRSSALMLALDMTGVERLLGSPQRLGQRLFQAARELGFFARVVCSSNIHTAACLLRTPGDTLVIVPHGQEQERLQHIPLSALDLTEELRDTFHAWGLRTAGDLSELLPEDLVARLGQEGHRLHRLARGAHPHLLMPAEPRFILEERIAFDSPVDNLESLLFALAPMLDQLIARARNRALLLSSLTVRLHLERPADTADRQQDEETEAPSEDPTFERTLKPALPLDERALLLKLLQLDMQAHPAPAAVLGITLHAEPGPRPGVQSGLFSPQSPEPMRLEVTLARLAALVGEERVGKAVLTDSHAQVSFRLERFTVTGEEHTPPARPVTSRAEPATLPRTGIALRRLRPAPPIQAVLKAGQLTAFTVSNRVLSASHYAVQRAFGPWRGSGQWWSGDVWSHEEWDIDAQAPDGSRLLGVVSNDRLRLQWTLEALYD